MTPDAAYQVLGLDEHASATDIRRAYRELVKVWHPDRFTGDPALQEKAARQLQRINQAYAVLRSTQRAAQPHPRRPPFRPSRRAAPAASPPAPPAPSGSRRRPSHLSRRAAGIAGAGLVAVFAMLGLWRSTQPAIAPERSLNAPAVRPNSGDELLGTDAAGYGVLAIDNTGTADAVVLLADRRSNRRAVYVRGGAQVQMLDVAPGRYTVRIASGLEWTGERFERDGAVQEFAEPIEFSERDVDGVIEATKLTITLPPAGATARVAVPAGRALVPATWVRMPRDFLSAGGWASDLVGMAALALSLADAHLGPPIRSIDPLVWVLILMGSAAVWIMMVRSR